jgi:hypothetical protein
MVRGSVSPFDVDAEAKWGACAPMLPASPTTRIGESSARVDGHPPALADGLCRETESASMARITK